jgi:two-component system sensor histidine kinase DesK
MPRWSPIPAEYGLGWTAYGWLIYLIFVFVDPVLSHASAGSWALTLGGLAVFLVLYFASYRVTGWLEYAVPLAMMALGAAQLRENSGTMSYLIYAAPALAWARPFRHAWLRLLLQVAATAAIVLLLGIPLFPALLTTAFTGFAGAMAIRTREMRDADQRLRLANERISTVAERERIARDLHDVLGHTLSLVVLKSELAARLVERGDERAIGEVRDIERIARDALGDVRAAIAGYRASTLETELEAARAMLAAAGIEFACDLQAVRLESLQESVLALALREAITNVARHARARHCSLALTANDGRCELDVRDDGSGGDAPDGAGLRGMRERVEALGGSVVRERAGGTRLRVSLPLET